MFFIIIERLWKIFNTKYVYVVQKPWKKMCNWYFFYVEDCVAASGNILMFFNESATASEMIFNDCFWNLFIKKMCDCFSKKKMCFLEIMPT